jgi:hypothetical protein
MLAGANVAMITSALLAHGTSHLARVRPEVSFAMMTLEDKERIRRAIRYAVRVSHEPNGDADAAYLLDLLPYLKDDARAVAQDETTRVLAEIVGTE